MLLPTEYAASSFLRLVSGIMCKFLHKVFSAHGPSFKPGLKFVLIHDFSLGVILLLLTCSYPILIELL